jgi:hypothetical protein
MRTSAHASRDQPRVQPYATHTAEHEGALSRAHVGRSGRLWHRRLPQEIRISEVDQNLYTFRPVIKKGPTEPGCSHNDKKIRGRAKSAARRADQAAQSRRRCGTGEPSPGAGCKVQPTPVHANSDDKSSGDRRRVLLTAVGKHLRKCDAVASVRRPMQASPSISALLGIRAPRPRPRHDGHAFP